MREQLSFEAAKGGLGVLRRNEFDNYVSQGAKYSPDADTPQDLSPSVVCKVQPTFMPNKLGDIRSGKSVSVHLE